LILGSKKIRTEPVSMKHFLVTTTGVENEDIGDEINLFDHRKVHVYYPIMDAVTCNMITRFCTESLQLA